MSQLLIQKYLNDLETLRRVSGTNRESVVRRAFERLLEEWGKSRGLVLIPEWEHRTAADDRRLVDGALVEPQLRLPFGYWEAKDTNDDLDQEIAKKLRRGYPQDNIVFEDSETAVLIQNKREAMRCSLTDPDATERLVAQFFKYEPEIIREFRKAVEQFKEDLPAVLATLRAAIEKAESDNPKFKQAAVKFLKHAQETINPSVTAADVREMLIQHILTEEIFSQVFDNSDFHHNNNVAKELYALEATFFTGGVKRETIDRLKPYYAAIRSAAALVFSHQEKQRFLKVIYENFYKVYNRKAADRLGVAYTPNEIVRFMIESADWLCQKHFGKRLIDRNVEILDPATGTGTFIVDLLEHFRGQKDKLRYKYLEELHANEVAILPYYVANLNIEATYAAITGEYLEYPNLCFVDTLDNLGWSRRGKGPLGDLFGAVSEENVLRIKRQNERKISVVIGNPPYNANQLNENENNKNRKYPAIDNRIRQTYVALSRAQKTKQYDMFVRFIRWASDRIEDDGIVAFITNRSFVDKYNFDGYRKTLGREFKTIYVVDLGGDWKVRGVGGGGNVFGISTGVAISFLVKETGKSEPVDIHYAAAPISSGQEKLNWLAAESLSRLSFERIEPDPKGTWIGLASNDFDKLPVPLVVKVKSTRFKRPQQRTSTFAAYSLGISTNRDEWLYDDDRRTLEKKAKVLIAGYDAVRPDTKLFPDTIKWSETLKLRKEGGAKEGYSKERIRQVLYRPFCPRWLYQSPLFVDRPGAVGSFFPIGRRNLAICFSDTAARAGYSVLAVSQPIDLHFAATSDGYQQVARYRFSDRERIDNITDWALEQFRGHYETPPLEKGRSSRASGSGGDQAEASENDPHPASLRPADLPFARGGKAITKDAIFHYVYGVLHDPVYREKYALNLKREFPRIPFYADFWTWADWGKALMALHIGYETVEPWPLKRVDTVDKTAKKSGIAPKALLKARKDIGVIELDSETQLTGVPPEAWEYRLGNRSALEWILDQYKEKTPKDPTIREKFNTYRFADYKDHVIDLLKRVTRVSVETMKIVEEMTAAKDAR